MNMRKRKQKLAVFLAIMIGVIQPMGVFASQAVQAGGGGGTTKTVEFTDASGRNITITETESSVYDGTDTYVDGAKNNKKYKKNEVFEPVILALPETKNDNGTYTTKYNDGVHGEADIVIKTDYGVNGSNIQEYTHSMAANNPNVRDDYQAVANERSQVPPSVEKVYTAGAYKSVPKYNKKTGKYEVESYTGDDKIAKLKTKEEKIAFVREQNKKAGATDADIDATINDLDAAGYFDTDRLNDLYTFKAAKDKYKTKVDVKIKIDIPKPDVVGITPKKPGDDPKPPKKPETKVKHKTKKKGDCVGHLGEERREYSRTELDNEGTETFTIGFYMDYTPVNGSYQKTPVIEMPLATVLNVHKSTLDNFDKIEKDLKEYKNDSFDDLPLTAEAKKKVDNRNKSLEKSAESLNIITAALVQSKLSTMNSGIFITAENQKTMARGDMATFTKYIKELEITTRIWQNYENVFKCNMTGTTHKSNTVTDPVTGNKTITKTTIKHYNWEFDREEKSDRYVTYDYKEANGGAYIPEKSWQVMQARCNQEQMEQIASATGGNVLNASSASTSIISPIEEKFKIASYFDGYATADLFYNGHGCDDDFTCNPSGVGGNAGAIEVGGPNSADFVFFRDNLEHTIVNDIWHLTGPLDSGWVFNNKDPLVTFADWSSNGTPDDDNEFTLKDMTGNKVDWRSPKMYSGGVNTFIWNASWASIKNRPHEMSLKYAYKPHSISYVPYWMIANGEVHYQAIEETADMYCMAHFNNPTPYMPEIHINATEDVYQVHPMFSSGEESYTVRFVKTSKE